MPNLKLVVNNEYRIFYSGMEKDELVGYCDIHCETEIALFHQEMYAQMIEYAGCPENYPSPDEVIECSTEFHSMHENMKTLVYLARSKQS